MARREEAERLAEEVRMLLALVITYRADTCFYITVPPTLSKRNWRSHLRNLRKALSRAGQADALVSLATFSVVCVIHMNSVASATLLMNRFQHFTGPRALDNAT